MNERCERQRIMERPLVAILIGTDEAGYGPNLGPLVISATVWRVPNGSARTPDLYRLLKPIVRPDATSDQHLAIADSKLLYKPGNGLGKLELGVLSCLSTWADHAPSWRELWRTLVPDAAGYLEAESWYAGYDASLPMSIEARTLEASSRRLTAGLAAAQVSLLRMQSSAVFPARFNELLDEHESKGAALSIETLQLVKHLEAECDDQRIVIHCDKHGGRNRYGALLQTLFPEYLVEIVRESRAASVYRWGPADRRIEVRFVPRGESFLPTALASMTSKYLRELAMSAFNRFWRQHLPDLKPTAGYPTDAKRFKQQIGEVQRQLGIEDRVLWRNK